MLFNLIKEVKTTSGRETIIVKKQFSNPSIFKVIITFIIGFGVAFTTAYLLAKYLTKLFIWLIIKTVGFKGFPIVIAILLDVTIMVIAMLGGAGVAMGVSFIIMDNIIKITKEGIIVYHLDKKKIILKKEFKFPKSLKSKKVKKDLNKTSVKNKVSDFFKNKLEVIEKKSKDADEKIAEFENQTA